ncbi:response regulator [Haloferula sp.]|uniref:response regulator n=1 Tax=Haloferula sp. TaxID=2497595 RepID=UPI003C7435F1
MKFPLKVFLIEDSPKYREVIDLSFRRHEKIDICDQFGTAEKALAVLGKLPPEKLPDVILLDLNLPGISGIEMIPKLKQLAPEVEILILTQSERETDIYNGITRGASGYLLKSATIREIEDGILSVAAGEASLDPGVAKYILKSMKQLHEPGATVRSLSARELEVLQLLAEGLVQKEIAHSLEIGVTTVAYHIKHIYEKLNVQNAPAAVAKAYQSGVFRQGPGLS